MKIMVCHDGSEQAQRSLERCVELFGSLRPEIIIITVVEEILDATSRDEQAFNEWRTTRDEDLEKAARWVFERGFKADAILAVGDPRKMIIEAAENKRPDFIVMARRGKGLIEDMILGSVSAYIVRHSSSSVLIVH